MIIYHPSRTRPRPTGSRLSDLPATVPGVDLDRPPLVLRLPFRPPLHPGNLFGHLVATAVPGVEEWRDGAYRCTLRLPHGPGVAALTPPATPGDTAVGCRLLLADGRDADAAVAHCRWLLDLDADPAAIDERLAADPLLAPLVIRVPGRRVPRVPDPAGFAVRAVIGQQVSTAAARTHGARLVSACGEPVTDPEGGLTHLFPSAEAVAGVDPAALAMPAARRRTVVAVARALVGGLTLGPGADPVRARALLGELPGVGPWTVETIAMRALGDGDAFPPTDLGVRQAARAIGVGDRPGPLTAQAVAWRPYRAYAVQHLWAVLAHPVNQLPAPARPPPRSA